MSLYASCTFLFCSFVLASHNIWKTLCLHPFSPFFPKIKVALIYASLWLTIVGTWKKIRSFLMQKEWLFWICITFTIYSLSLPLSLSLSLRNTHTEFIYFFKRIILSASKKATYSVCVCVWGGGREWEKERDSKIRNLCNKDIVP